jgi:hypothetical protein
MGYTNTYSSSARAVNILAIRKITWTLKGQYTRWNKASKVYPMHRQRTIFTEGLA